jgi:antitoxin component of MazEF toxin-antitoxin module
MKLKIRRYGNSAGVTIPAWFMKLYQYKIGQIIEVRINRVSNGSHSHNKQKPKIQK